MPDLAKLAPFDKDDALQMIVETPRGSGVKLVYDPQTRVFTVKRALAVGISYPFDWGFIPGTEGEDGDPVDALALHDNATYPGVVLPCRPLGVVDVSQAGEHGREQNPRVILIPTWHDRMGDLEKASGLPDRLKQEIEQFFLSATFLTGKDARIEGWRGPNAVMQLVKSKQR
jgi:inorganic pyrophosphatase